MPKIISNQIFICISIFVTKLCICFDNKLAKPWSEAFGLTYDWSGTFVSICHPFLLSIGVSINIVISCYVFESTIPQIICWLALTLIEIWTIHSVVKLLRSDSRPTLLQSIPETPKVKIRAESKPFYEKELNVKNLDLKPIGWTQFATTYRSQGNQSEDLTLKVIDFEAYVHYYYGLLTDEKKAESIQKLSREFKLLHVISHENISKFIKIYNDKKKLGDIDVTQRLILVSKWAPFSLHSYLEKESPNGVDRGIAKVWFKQLVGAVHYLHLQLKKNHMNIKPENILLSLKGQESKDYELKLSESGLNEYFTKSGQITTDNNKFLISPPEFVFGRKITRVVRNRLSANTLETDIYSLGVILVLLLKGNVKNFSKTPKVMEMQNIRELQTEVDSVFVDFSWKKSKQSVKTIFDKDLDRDLVSILRGMLQKIPEKRFDISRIKKHKWLKSVQN